MAVSSPVVPGAPRAEARVRTIPFEPLKIALDRCKGCELCVTVCPKGVLSLDVGFVNRLGYHPVRLTDPDRCTSCAICARVCPDAVFTVYARPREG